MTEFKKELLGAMEEVGVNIDDTAADRFCIYYDMLIERNKVMNLTALTEPRDVALKHFADSLTLLKYCDIPEGASVIDVGTGAGFPGLALKTARPDIKLTLLDCLNKRLDFLNELCEALGFSDVITIHSRAEDAARDELRDSFDFAVSRAVASLNTLCEYCLPYVKAGGGFLAMKGRGAEEELKAAEKAIAVLSGEVKAKHSFELAEAGEREIIEIVKTAPTPAQYPRKSKAIKNKPL